MCIKIIIELLLYWLSIPFTFDRKATCQLIDVLTGNVKKCQNEESITCFACFFCQITVASSKDFGSGISSPFFKSISET